MAIQTHCVGVMSRPRFECVIKDVVEDVEWSVVGMLYASKNISCKHIIFNFIQLQLTSELKKILFFFIHVQDVL